MNKILISSLITILFTSSAVYSTNNKPNLDLYIGRIIRSTLRFPYNSLNRYISNPKGETSEAIIQELINNNLWNKFTYNEKKEFTLICLIYGINDMQGGSLTSLLILLGPDSIKISTELSTISDDILKNRFYLNSSGIDSFRKTLDFLSGKY